MCWRSRVVSMMDEKQYTCRRTPGLVTWLFWVGLTALGGIIGTFLVNIVPTRRNSAGRRNHLGHHRRHHGSGPYLGRTRATEGSVMGIIPCQSNQIHFDPLRQR